MSKQLSSTSPEDDNTHSSVGNDLEVPFTLHQQVGVWRALLLAGISRLTTRRDAHPISSPVAGLSLYLAFGKYILR